MTGNESNTYICQVTAPKNKGYNIKITIKQFVGDKLQ